MASSNKRTKVLPFIFFSVLAIVVGGFFYMTQVGIPDGEGKKQVFDMQTKRLKTVDIDADTPITTINTIAVNSIDFKEKLQDVEESNFEAKQRMEEMSNMLKEMSKTNLLLKQQLEQQNRKMKSVETAMNTPKTIDAESIKASVMGVLERNLPSMIKDSGIIDTKSPNREEGGDYEISDKPKYQPKVRTRVRSYGLPAYDPSDPKQRPSSRSREASQTDANDASTRSTGYLSKMNSPFNTPEEVVVDPRFTIPPDSSLFDSVTISVLRGRIPKDGDVSDPSPFKVAIGRDNLAANGFSMPGISGMIMSGTVYGDLVGKCVRTKILRATYIFEDGRILTLPKKRNKGTAIGYIASPVGDPCIKGRYVSNGNAQQAKSILANMASGAANAYAQTQVTSQTNNQGGSSSVVTGNDKKFVLGAAISNGANSIAATLAKQQFDQWDYIIVDVGQIVTINIDEQLEIDNASNLRKISYENENATYGLTD